MLILFKYIFKKIWIFSFCTFAIAGIESHVKPPPLTAKDVRVKVEELLLNHAIYHSLDEEIIRRAFNNYIEIIDPYFSYFIEPEIIKWIYPSEQLLHRALKEWKEEKFSLFEQIDRLMVQAIKRRRRLEQKLIDAEFPQNVDSFEFKDMRWAKSEKELEDRLFRMKGLQLKTAKKNLDKEEQTAFFKRLEKQRVEKEEEWMTSNPTYKQQFLFSYILKAVSSAFDSQTAYFIPSEAYQFLIQMEQRLFGIGVELRDDFDGFTITRFLENSPLGRAKGVNLGDRIIAINHEPVIGMGLIEVVELIRGPPNSVVVLTLLREAGDCFDVEVVREEIVLAENRSLFYHEPFQNGVIAVIKLFSFYQDTRHSSSIDLTDAIEKLRKKHLLKGVILDLRDNSGGVLSQAISVAGLFIKKGSVVVSVKNKNGFIQRLRNKEEHLLWEGPLIVLVNRITASAAEIVAQTLQEYGRALIVGDPETYGKGTFQTFTLGAVHAGEINPKGEFKITRGKYYTVSGKTPQLVGVSSDIVVPGMLTEMEIGEKFSKFPLKGDSIPASFEDDLSDPLLGEKDFNRKSDSFVSGTYLPYINVLKKNSEERIKNNQQYQKMLNCFLDNNSFIELNDFQLNETVGIMKELLTLIEKSDRIKAA